MMRTGRRDNELCHLGNLVDAILGHSRYRPLRTNIRYWDRTIVVSLGRFFQRFFRWRGSRSKP